MCVKTWLHFSFISPSGIQKLLTTRNRLKTNGNSKSINAVNSLAKWRMTWNVSKEIFIITVCLDAALRNVSIDAPSAWQKKNVAIHPLAAQHHNELVLISQQERPSNGWKICPDPGFWIGANAFPGHLLYCQYPSQQLFKCTYWIRHCIERICHIQFTCLRVNLHLHSHPVASPLQG